MSIWQENNLFPSSKSASIAVPESHELVRLTGLIDCVSLTHIAMTCREKTRKRLTGVEPRYRQLLGALVLMATRGCNYRDAEDLISFYAPARYLCDLMDSEIGLDHVTIFEFTQMLGPTGMESINKGILQHAVKAGLCNPKIMMSDTTAQEARIPISHRSWLDEPFPIYRKSNGWENVRQIRHPEGRGQRGLSKGAGITPELALVCQGAGSKAQDRAEDVPHRQRDPEKDCVGNRVWRICQKSRGPGF